MRFVTGISLCCLVVAAIAAIDDHDHIESRAEPKKKHTPHHFPEGEEVPFYVNKIGPYSNPVERYEYYDLPFCRPDVVQHAHGQRPGEHIVGNHLRTSLYDLRFGVPVHWRSLCKAHLLPTEVQKFKEAIDKYYYFELKYDDLPLHGFIGTIDVELKDNEEIKHYYLFKHLHFHVLKNKDQVIFVNVTADPSKLEELKDTEMTVEFSYSVTWEDTDWPFKDRMKLYEDIAFFRGLEIHWLSIMNSLVLVLLLTGFLAIIIMRILKSDYSRYARDEEGDDDQEDYGWKLIHGEVFRFPPFKSLFTAFIGLGSQCLCIMIGVMVLALAGMFQPNNNGAMFMSIIVLYAITCGVAGFVSASYYRQFEGDKWSWNLIMVASLITAPFLIVFMFVNTLATIYHATAAVPIGTILLIVFILIAVGFPLTLVGGIAGKRTAGNFQAPCRTKNFAREIPPIAFYRSLPAQMVMSGFLPFSAIYIELFYIYSSVWGHSSYQLFGILTIVFAILLVVTACITVALTYFQLSMEDYRWWWNSFFTGGSTGLFIYAYSIFYYVWRSNMSGILQGSFYFAYMFIVCYFFFVMLGTVGFLSSLVFVRRIYLNLKCD